MLNFDKHLSQMDWFRCYTKNIKREKDSVERMEEVNTLNKTNKQKNLLWYSDLNDSFLFAPLYCCFHQLGS